MRVSRLMLKNWRNFTDVDIELAQRVFIVGNNGLGKSNLLDVFRFLHDIAKERGGGLQQAVDQRGGMKSIRSLFAARNPRVTIEVEVWDEESEEWSYHLTLKQEAQGKRRVLVESEVVKRNEEMILNRPTDGDRADAESLTQTALEQIQSNKDFRPLVKFFQDVSYLHLVPQLIRHAADLRARVLPDDPYGQNLLNEIAQLTPKLQKSRLDRITKIMRQIKPAFSGFEFKRDAITGAPHLEYRHQNWRKNGAIQNEEQLSDGELRLIGLLWAFMRGNPMVLLEEPEIYFNEGIVRELPTLLFYAMRARKKPPQSQQTMLSTHSDILLSDQAIGADEVVLLTPGKNGETQVAVMKDDTTSRAQFKAGMLTGDIVLPLAQSGGVSLNLFN